MTATGHAAPMSADALLTTLRAEYLSREPVCPVCGGVMDPEQVRASGNSLPWYCRAAAEKKDEAHQEASWIDWPTGRQADESVVEACDAAIDELTRLRALALSPEQREALSHGATLLAEMSKLTRHPDMRDDSISVHWYPHDGDRAGKAYEVVAAIIATHDAARTAPRREDGR